MYAVPDRDVRLSAELQREKKGLGDTFLVTYETPQLEEHYEVSFALPSLYFPLDGSCSPAIFFPLSHSHFPLLHMQIADLKSQTKQQMTAYCISLNMGKKCPKLF